VTRPKDPQLHRQTVGVIPVHWDGIQGRQSLKGLLGHLQAAELIQVHQGGMQQHLSLRPQLHRQAAGLTHQDGNLNAQLRRAIPGPRLDPTRQHQVDVVEGAGIADSV